MPQPNNAPSQGLPEWIGYAIVPGVVLAILCMICCGAISALLLSPQPSTPAPTPSLAEELERLRVNMENSLNVNKQRLFQQIHPVGTATKVDVHHAEFVAGPGGETVVAYRYTLYWEGPITKNGFTKLLSIYDPESRRTLHSEILGTNGMTNEQATQNLIDLFFILAGEAMKQ